MRFSLWNLEFETVTVADGLEVSLGGDPEQLTITLRAHRELRLPELRLRARLQESARGGAVWLHGRYMQKDALVHRFGSPPAEGYLGEYRQGEWLSSASVMCVRLPSRQPPVLLIGALRLDRCFVDVRLQPSAGEQELRALEVRYDLEDRPLAAGEQLELPALLLQAGEDPLALIERWAERVGRLMGARVPGRVPTGWCSWYYFYNQVSQADVLANLEAMARHQHPAEVVQVDDGFQSATGDWLTPNQRFPDGMAFLARRIAEAGYRPGLWLAPLVLHESSTALRERPELALRTPSGDLYWIECWLGRCAVLDCSRPAGESWLREVIRTSVRDWGYSYLKLDAMAFAAAPAREVCYADPRLTGPAHLRRGLQIIREEAGEEVFLLGCTCHFGSAVGLVEGMRVGPDVKALWADGTRPSVRQAMRMTLQRGFLHGRFWVNDPDCLIVRETDTALGEAEVRFLATGIALSGGMVVLSDDLPRLGPERRRMALALFPPTGVAARPLDPWEAPVASAWRSELGEGRALLGLLNWTDRPRELDPAAVLGPGEVAFDVWNGELVGTAPRLLRAREGALWQVSRPAPPPRWVGDTGHLTGQGLEILPGRPALLRNQRPYPRRVAVDLGAEVRMLDLAAGATVPLHS